MFYQESSTFSSFLVLAMVRLFRDIPQETPSDERFQSPSDFGVNSLFPLVVLRYFGLCMMALDGPFSGASVPL